MLSEAINRAFKINYSRHAVSVNNNYKLIQGHITSY